MKLNISVCLTVVLLILSTTIQAQERFLLNELEPAEVQKTRLSEPDQIYYTLNEEAFNDGEFRLGSEFIFTFQDQEKSFIITRKTEYFPGYISIIAKEKGAAQNTFAATYSKGRLNGRYHESHDQTIFLNYDVEEGKNYFSAKKSTADKPLACGIHGSESSLVTPPRSLKQISESRKKESGAQTKTMQKFSSPDDSITIDLMLVYTNAAETWASTSSLGNINGVMAQALNLSQTALNNSKTRIELRLVHAYNTSYNEESDKVNSEARLRRLTQNPENPQFEEEYDGYMEEVHDLRNQYGADVVSLLLNINDTGGLGWRLNSTGGEPAYAFNLNRVQQVANGYTLIHEIGHNMGNAHSRTQDSEAARDAGGLFHYSTGYQNIQNNFHTVMAYADGLSEAAIFSSPNLTWQGVSTGTTRSVTPEDNARSMKEVKGAVASYRQTIVDPPSASLSTDEITAEMNREDELTVSFDISNTGESSLMWNADFDFVGLGVEKRIKTSSKESRDPVKLEHLKQAPVNYSSYLLNRRKGISNEVLYSTSFETSDGFFTGSFSGREDWIAQSETEFVISDVNPKSGSQHYRLEYDDSGNTHFMSSPFMGYQLFGGYEVTVNFSISNVNETYDFYILDGKTGDFSSGVIIADQTMFAAENDEQGQGGITFFGTGASISANNYYELKIVYNTENQTIDYYLNNNLLKRNEYLATGNTPSLIRVLHRNQLPGTFMDVDDVEIRQLETPYSWLSLGEMSGVTFEGESDNVELTFNTEGLSAGTYETVLKVNTNDPQNEILEIPITLDVRDVVSNEVDASPKQVSLEQNYPNPFNPTTNIRYNLQEAQNVKLEVFNTQGQKVATIVNERQSAGEQQVTFDATNFSSGIYVYRLQAGAEILTRKMVLIK